MHRLFLLLITLTLAACSAAPLATAGAPYATATPATLPLDVQRAVLDVYATGTVQAAATAQAATAQRAAEATAARVETEQALTLEREQAELAALRTQVALSVTLQVAAATSAAGETQRAGTATVAAVGTLAALDRVGIVATGTAIAASAQIAAAGVDGLRGLVQTGLVLAVLLGVVVIAIMAWGTLERERIKTAQMEQRQSALTEQAWAVADQLQIETQRQRAEAMRSLMIERNGAAYVVTPTGQLVPMLAGPTTTTPQVNRAHEWRWRSACKAVVYTGIALGEQQHKTARFGERDLASREQPHIVDGSGLPSSAGYRDLQRLLVRAGVWVAVDRKGTYWARGWNEERFAREFDQIDLPDLPAGEPPTVRTLSRSSAPAAIAAVSAAPQPEGVGD